MEGSIPGPVMAHYLMSLLGQHDPVAALFAGGLGGGLPENGRMGDYVFNQEGKIINLSIYCLSNRV